MLCLAVTPGVTMTVCLVSAEVWTPALRTRPSAQDSGLVWRIVLLWVTINICKTQIIKVNILDCWHSGLRWLWRLWQQADPRDDGDSWQWTGLSKCDMLRQMSSIFGETWYLKAVNKYKIRRLLIFSLAVHAQFKIFHTHGRSSLLILIIYEIDIVKP